MHPAVGDARDLGDGEVDVVDRNLTRHDQPLRIDRRPFEHRVVERARRRDGGLRVLEQIEVAEAAHLGVDDLDLDAVGIHVEQALGGVAVARPAERGVRVLLHRVGVRAGRAHRAQRLLLERRDRAVVGAVVLVREVCLDPVVAHVHVRVRRDEPFSHCGTSP